MESKFEDEASFNAIVMSHNDEGSLVDEVESDASAEESVDQLSIRHVLTPADQTCTSTCMQVETNSKANSDCRRSSGNITMEQHFSGIEKMVLELKQGFVEVMEALSVMQEDDGAVKKNLADMSDTLETVQTDQNDIRHRQTEDEEACKKNGSDIQTLKSEVSSLSSQLSVSVEKQDSLEEKVRILQAERNLLVDELCKTGAISERVKLQLSDIKGTNSDSWSRPESDHQLPSNRDELPSNRDQQGPAVDSSVEDGVTASACKCLSLLQALEEKCRLPELPDSSDEDAFQQWSQSLERREETSSIQQSFPSPDSNPVDTQDHSDAERQEAVQAIIDSEKEYVTKLWSLLDGYLGPLQAGHVISSRELSLLIPPYLHQVYDQHCQVLHLLQERILHWSWSGIVGDVLTRVTHAHNDSLMSLYQSYLSDFPAIVGCLRRQLAQSRKFRLFIKQETNSEGIVSLLTAPIRRIPRYSLLLQQLLKHTPTMHPDHYILQSSLSQLQSFVDQFSEQIKQTLGVDKDHARSGALSFRSSPSGSSCDTGILPCSARDNILHEDNVQLRRGFHDSRENYLPQWIESSITERQEYHESKLASLSQPNLAFGRFSAPPEHLNQTHSAFRGAPSGFVDRPSNHRKYRIKKRLERGGVNYPNYRPAGPNALPPAYSTSQSAASLYSRPASAVDFVHGYDTSGTRPGQNHVFRRPQSALGGLYRSDGRSKSLHSQLFQRKYPDGYDSLVCGSRSSSHSMTPSPADSPRTAVNGNIEDIREFCERSDVLFQNTDEDDDTRADTTTGFEYDSYRDTDSENVEQLKLAVSLAESLQQDREFEHSVETHGSEHPPLEISSMCRDVNKDYREYLKSRNTDNRTKSSVAHIHELRLDIKNLDDHDDSLSGGKQSVHSDSTYLPNSTFEESVRSDSNHSGNHLIRDGMFNGFSDTLQEEPTQCLTSQTKPEQDSSSGSHDSGTGSGDNGTEYGDASEKKDTALHAGELSTGERTSSEYSPKVMLKNEDPVITNGEPFHHGTSRLQPVSVPVPQLRETEMRKEGDASVLSCDERILASCRTNMPSGLEKMLYDQDTSSGSQNHGKAKSRQTFTNSADIQNSLMKNDDRKKKKDAKRCNSLENLSKSVDDINGGKKSTLKSLKHFFGKKKGSVRLDQLEAAYFKQHGYPNHGCENKPTFRGDYSLQATQENSMDSNTPKELVTENEKLNGEMVANSVDGNHTCDIQVKGDNSLACRVTSATANNTGSNDSFIGDDSIKSEQINTLMKKKKSPLFFIFRDQEGQSSSNV